MSTQPLAPPVTQHNTPHALNRPAAGCQHKQPRFSAKLCQKTLPQTHHLSQALKRPPTTCMLRYTPQATGIIEGQNYPGLHCQGPRGSFTGPCSLRPIPALLCISLTKSMQTSLQHTATSFLPVGGRLSFLYTSHSSPSCTHLPRTPNPRLLHLNDHPFCQLEAARQDRLRCWCLNQPHPAACT